MPTLGKNAKFHSAGEENHQSRFLDYKLGIRRGNNWLRGGKAVKMAYLHFFAVSINRRLQPNLDANELIIAINLSYSRESKVFDISACICVRYNEKSFVWI